MSTTYRYAMPQSADDSVWDIDEPPAWDEEPPVPDDEYAIPSRAESAARAVWAGALGPSIPLHDMEPAELRAFADTLGIDGPRTAIPEDVRTLLYLWCMTAADSVDNTVAGRYDAYDRLADECGRLYDQLPDRYRW